MKVIYTAGPYRAKTEWGVQENIQRAEKAALALWAKGWVVICPHKNTANFGGACDDSIWLRGDLEIISRCDAVCMLPGWEKSEGAQIEYGLALELEMPVYFGVENVPDGRA